MSDSNERSRYWLSPGIDVPTRTEILPGLRPMRGLYVHVDAGEAVFVPTDAFMRATPLWRLDVLGDIAESVERLNGMRPSITFGGSTSVGRTCRWINDWRHSAACVTRAA